ncbi:hypothetical protein CJJ23_02985 [Mycoplasmopsis agassizii]|uniref:DNA 5'-3' helicase n=2 Tax=Mycoplasmopsis agassizii TaxID=33922 RepID=A0A269TK33_9BACT|nr:hypothetical protein CJJ23_02985 [Mycoplasmopsis agassizii]
MMESNLEKNISDPISELNIIASLVFKNDLAKNIRHRLKADDFYLENHRIFFTIIDSYLQITKFDEQLDNVKNLTFDVLKSEVRNLLNQNPRIRNVKDFNEEYVNELLIKYNGSDRFFEDFKTVIEKSNIRKILLSLDKNSRLIRETIIEDNSNLIISRINHDLTNISDLNSFNEFDQLEDLAADYLESIHHRRNSYDDIAGIATGYEELDNLTDGWQKGNLIILAARPSMGKTALSLNFALNAAKENKTVLYFSLEMDSSQLVERLISKQTTINPKLLRNPKDLSSENLTKISIAVNNFRKYKLNIASNHSSDFINIQSIIRQEYYKNTVDLVMIDYLQLMSLKNYGGDNRQLEVSKISNMLKSLARELSIPIIALAQLSRNVESRADKRPVMSDLRDSGAIEQDADIIMMMYRDDYYNRKPSDKEEMHNSNYSVVELSVVKNRSGATGTINLLFDLSHSNFLTANDSYGDNYKKYETR